MVISDTASVTLHPSDRLSVINKVSRLLALTKIGNRYHRNDLPPSWPTWRLQTELIPARKNINYTLQEFLVLFTPGSITELTGESDAKYLWCS